MTIVRPRRVGTFLISRRPTSAKLRARSQIRSMSARSRSSIESRCLIAVLRPLPPSAPATRRRADRHLVDAVDLLEADEDALVAGGRQVLAGVVGPDRQLAVAAVGEHGELDPGGAAVVEEGVDRGADRAAGEEDVVDEDDRAALEVEVEVGGVDDGRLGGAAAEHVVAVEGDVDVAERHRRRRRARRRSRAGAARGPLPGCGCRRSRARRPRAPPADSSR